MHRLLPQFRSTHLPIHAFGVDQGVSRHSKNVDMCALRTGMTCLREERVHFLDLAFGIWNTKYLLGISPMTISLSGRNR